MQEQNFENQNLLYNEMIKSTTELKTKYFTTSFKDEEMETNYLTYHLENKKIQTVIYIVILILSHVSSIISGIFLKINLFLYYLVNSICLLTTCFALALYFVVKSPRRKCYIELLCFIMFTISVMSNSYCLLKMNSESESVMRILYVMIIVSNLSLLIWTQTNFVIWLIICLLKNGYFVLLISLSKEFKSRVSGYEIASDILASICFFGVKKFYDNVIRITFLQRIKYQNFFNYNRNLINCMSGFHLTFSSNGLIYMNDNTRNLVNDLMGDKKICGGN